jgi:hypothetical protein
MSKRMIMSALLAGCLALSTLGFSGPIAEARSTHYNSNGCDFYHSYASNASTVSSAQCPSNREVAPSVSFASPTGARSTGWGRYVRTGYSQVKQPGHPCTPISGYWGTR